MSLLTSAIIDAVSTDADALRRVYQMLAQGQQGVYDDAALKVTAGAGMQSVMAAGRGLANGTQNTVTQGSYGVTNDANVTQTHSASDPTNPRNDLVGIKIEDAFYAGSNKQATPVIITGTPAASPSDPATPANFLPLARVRVNAGASTLGTITDLRTVLGTSLYRCRAVMGAATKSLANNAFTPITGWTEVFDLNSNFDPTTGLYTAPLPGDYEVVGGFITATSTRWIASLGKNGGLDSQRLADVGSSFGGLGCTIIPLAAGDTIVLQGWQNSGGAISTLGNQDQINMFQVRFLGR